MKTRNLLIGALMLVLGSSAMGWVVYRSHERVSAAPAVEPAPAGAQQPSPLFLSQYDTWKGLSDDVSHKQAQIQKMNIVKDLQDEQDRLVGFAQRLNQQVPTGFSFDEKSRTFVPIPSKPATTTPGAK
jgi:hypothetical protein